MPTLDVRIMNVNVSNLYPTSCYGLRSLLVKKEKVFFGQREFLCPVTH